jgi:antitoxin component HigA of HigAB toxin-antitoxin module
MHQLTSEQSGETAPSELVATVDDLLNQLSSKFSNLSSEMIAKSEIARIQRHRNALTMFL